LPFQIELTLPESRHWFSLVDMTRKNIALWLLTAFALTACHKPAFQALPVGINAVNVSLSSGKWTVTIKNDHGSASDTMFAANDQQRSNIYLTSANQLVVIEHGGDDVFSKLPKDSAPVPLEARKYNERDTRPAIGVTLG
jgi:hypothetical protein